MEVGSERVEIEFCGQITVVDHQPFTIGRQADLIVDDSRFLHRRFLSLTKHNEIWLFANIGGQLTATISDVSGRFEAFLAPGGVLPIVCEHTTVRFNAGPTSYELSIRVPRPRSSAESAVELDRHQGPAGDATVGRVAMTPDQLRLIVALAEPALRGHGRATTSLPCAQDVIRRLGWTKTRYNRKLDSVCQKLAAQGVRGLHGGPGRLASSRRARLVEYALAVRMVTRSDLCLLDAPPPDLAAWP